MAYKEQAMQMYTASREKSVLWHRIWVECGRPNTGPVVDVMRRTRALYHYAVRRVKRDEQVSVRQGFADAPQQ